MGVVPARPEPDCAEKVNEELGGYSATKFPTPADLSRLVYTDTVLREAMRLYPPVWVIGRRALSPFRLGDYELPANTNMLISQVMMHRDARYFPEPERFDPNRWNARFANRLHFRDSPIFLSVGGPGYASAQVLR